MSGSDDGGVSVAGLRLPSDRPFSDNELAWIDFLRIVSSDRDPAPTLRFVRFLRQAVTKGRCI